MRRAVGIAIVLASSAGCKGKKEPHNALGEAAAAALLAGVGETSAVLEPWPCAALEDAPSAPPPGLRLSGWQLDGLALLPTESVSPAIGFVGDAAGDSPATISRLRRAAEEFSASKVALVISLGGMGETDSAIGAGLRELGKAGVPVVAIPGDLEPLPAHRRAVERLQQEQLPVVDGSVVRWVKLGTSTIATLPGARHQAQLAAGVEGCAFDDAAVEATLSRFGKDDGVAVLATWTAPREGSATAARGDGPLRQALEKANVALAVAGQEGRGPSDQSRAGRAQSELRVVHSGFADGEPRAPLGGTRRSAGALVLTLRKSEWQVRRVDLEAAK